MKQNQKIDVHGHSVRGERHDKNHDHFAIATLNKSMRLHQSNLSIDDQSHVHGNNQGHLFLVADGISGGPAPARASGRAVDSVVHYFLNEMPWSHFLDGDPEDVTLALEDAMRNAQDDLYLTANPETAGLGTTMTLAFVFWPDLYVAHVGDSRCFLSRRRSLEQLTTDHTLAELTRKSGVEATPRAENILWNAVGGAGSALDPEVRHMKLESGDVLALLTDGVSEQKDTDQLRRLLDREAPSEQLCRQLVGESGADDRTAIVVRFLPIEESRVTAVPVPEPDGLAAQHTKSTLDLPTHPRWKREQDVAEPGPPARKRLAQ